MTVAGSTYTATAERTTLGITTPGGSIVEYAAAVEAGRVVVNTPCRWGVVGFGANCAPTFAIGAGFFARFSVGDNISPQYSVNRAMIVWPQGDNAMAGPHCLAAADIARRRGSEFRRPPS